MPATAATLASPPMAPTPAAVLAAAALASCRSDPAIRGRKMVKRSLPQTSEAGSLAPSLAAPALLADASSCQPPPPPLVPSPCCLCSKSKSTSAAPSVLDQDLQAVPGQPAVDRPVLVRARSVQVPEDVPPKKLFVPASATTQPATSEPLRYATAGDELTRAPRPVSAVDDAEVNKVELVPVTASDAIKTFNITPMGENAGISKVTPQAAESSSLSTHLAQLAVRSEMKASEGWQEVPPRRGRRHAASPTPTLSPRPIPAWLVGRCCRCLAHGHRAAGCRDPFRCSRCLENGHCARECRNPWRPLSSLACLVVPAVSHFSVKDRQAPSSCESPMGSVLPSKSPCYGTWASIASTPAGSVPASDVVLRSTLAAQVERLEGYLARVGGVLERAETALSRLSLLPAMLTTTPTSRPPDEAGVGSVGRGAELYDRFSPRVGDNSSPVFASPAAPSTDEGETIARVVPPVLQIMPELREICASSALPLSAVHMEVDSPTTLSSPKRSDVISAPIPPPSALNPDALFAKELCDVLSSLEAANPGCGRAISCLLTGMSSKAKSKKVGECTRTDIRKEKSIRCKEKKNGASRTAPTVA